ncbi:hypothetical protein [Mariniphaga sediminis]|uniref:hypothetical protein n=1 Tax=Mariniphaga sediminis TaxID=1628158 RepID=UPI003568690D
METRGFPPEIRMPELMAPEVVDPAIREQGFLITCQDEAPVLCLSLFIPEMMKAWLW